MAVVEIDKLVDASPMDREEYAAVMRKLKGRGIRVEHVSRHLGIHPSELSRMNRGHRIIRPPVAVSLRALSNAVEEQ